MSRSDGWSDLELVQAARSGDPEAARRLGERLRCVERFVRRIRSRLSPPADASELADLAQESVTAVLESLGRFRGEGAFDAWVHQICRFTVWRAHRREQRYRPLEEEPMSDDDGSEESARERAERLLQLLTGPEARIGRMKHIDGLDFDEITARLGMPLSTVRCYYYRGLDRIRARVGVRGPKKKKDEGEADGAA